MALAISRAVSTWVGLLTDPQLVVPNGGDIRLDGPAREIHVRYWAEPVGWTC